VVFIPGPRLATSWQGINIRLSSHHPLSTQHPAFEDGTDRGFRNVGKSQSDTEEIPKRTHTIFKTRRKFEIKKSMDRSQEQLCYVNTVLTFL
jgi:hypothetical protein